MKYMRSSLGKIVYRKDPKFLDRTSGQTVQTEINLIRSNPSDKGLLSCHSACTLLLNRNNIIILVQGPAVLAAGGGWKLRFCLFFCFFLLAFFTL